MASQLIFSLVDPHTKHSRVKRRLIMLRIRRVGVTPLRREPLTLNSFKTHGHSNTMYTCIFGASL